MVNDTLSPPGDTGALDDERGSLEETSDAFSDRVTSAAVFQSVGAERSLGIERFLAQLHIGGGVFGAVQVTFNPEPYPTGLGVMMYALVTLVFATGAWALVKLRGEPDDATLEHIVRWTFAIDLLLLPAMALAQSFEQIGITYLILLLLPLSGALKYQTSGVIVASMVVMAEEVLRQIIRQQVWDLEPFWVASSFLLGMSVLAGGITARLTRDVHERAIAAEREAQRAQLMARQADMSNRDVTALHRVIAAGIGGRESDVLHRMLDELGGTLGYPLIAIVLGDDAKSARLAAWSGEDAPQEHLLHDRSPVRSVLEGNGARAARLSGWLVYAAPMRSAGRVIGALTVETGDRRDLSAQEQRRIQRLADQMGLLVEAARAYEQEIALNERYRELDRLKTDFVSITSHELRTPLTTLLGFTETLKRDDLTLSPEQLQRIFSSMHGQAKRLANLVDDLSTVSRLDAGTIEVDAVPMSLAQSVGKAVSGISWDHPPAVSDAKDLIVMGDPHRVHQILTNLLTNAIDHGGQNVWIDWREFGQRAVIRVQDDGGGIDDHLREAIFERFFQVQDTMEHSRGGGLGLPIARELARAMGGDVAIAEGTTTATTCFVFMAPLASGVIKPATAEAATYSGSLTLSDDGGVDGAADTSNRASTNDSGSNGARSSTSSPNPTSFTGSPSSR